MHVEGEFIAPDPGQALLRGILRANLQVFFRGLIRPPMPIAAQRAIMRSLSATCQPLAKKVPREKARLGGRDCEWHRPKGASHDSIILYLHGGGYLLGSPASHRPVCGTLAHLTQMPLCALDYRLSPEVRLPAAVEDVLLAYRQLRLEYPKARIFMGGDSAGGHLTLCAALALAKAGDALPAFRPW